MIINYPTSQSIQSMKPSGFYFASKPLRLSNCPVLPPNFQLTKQQLWNNNLCGVEAEYYQLFQAGDIIPVQLSLTDLVNTDETAPVHGFKTSTSSNHYIKVLILDADDNVIYSDIDDFCDDFWVDYFDNYGSVQTFFIDTSNIDSDDIFYIKVETYQADETTINQQIFSEPFKRVTNETTLEFTTKYGVRDGYNRNYKNTPALDDLPFYSWFRCEGALWLNSSSGEQIEADNDTILQTDIIEQYNMQAFMLPPYAQKLLTVCCYGQTVKLNGDYYTNFGSLTKETETGRMFFIETTCEQQTDVRHFDC